MMLSQVIHVVNGTDKPSRLFLGQACRKYVLCNCHSNWRPFLIQLSVVMLFFVTMGVD